MASLIDIKIPDIGEFHDVDVVEVMVKPGTANVDDSLITIESDKATMEVPSPQAGVVKEIRVKLGDKVSEGSAIIVIEVEAIPPPSPRMACRRAHGARGGRIRKPHQPRPHRRAGELAAAQGAPAAAALRQHLRAASRQPMTAQPIHAGCHRRGRGPNPKHSRMRARRCANSRANSAWICTPSRAPDSTAEFSASDVRSSSKRC